MAGENTCFPWAEEVDAGKIFNLAGQKMQIERYWTPQFCPDESKT